MYAQGKLKHRVHLLVFQRIRASGEEVLVEHVVTRQSRARAAWRKLCRSFGPDHVGWLVDEPYWREHGTGGRNTA